MQRHGRERAVRVLHGHCGHGVADDFADEVEADAVGAAVRGDGVELAGRDGEESRQGETLVGGRGGVEEGDGPRGDVVVVGVVAGFAPKRPPLCQIEGCIVEIV